ncbi:WD40 repeat-like protein [Peniophora sp. CONT]|nr:WD40 repeat-like protein [Peniophora sp. CONT]
MDAGPFNISADEVNCIVHAYLRDCGFEHAAFSLRSEARLDKSTNFQQQVPHGELVDLLGRALLFNSVENHPSGRQGCTAPISLLGKHICSSGRLPPAITPAPVSASPALPAVVSSTSFTPVPQVKKQEEPVAALASSMPMEVDSASGAVGNGEFLTNTELNAVQMLSGYDSEIFAIAWNPANPALIASGAKDSTVNIWKMDFASNDLRSSIITPDKPQSSTKLTDNDEADITSLDWNPSGTLLAVGAYDAKLRVLTASGDIYFEDSNYEAPIFAARFSPLGKWLVTASLDNRVCVWDVERRRLHRVPLFRGPCLDVAWYSENIYVVCGNDKRVSVMDVNGNGPVTVFVGHENEVNQVRINAKKTMIASASDDHTARIWLGSTIKIHADGTAPPHVTQCVVLRGHGASVNSVGWSGGDREIVATASFDKHMRLWDPRTGQCTHHFFDHTGPIFTLSFNKSGRLLATGAQDGLLHLYDMKTKTKVWSWRVEDKITSGVFDLAFQTTPEYERLCVGLESGRLGIVNLKRLPFLNL